jgi:mannan endo-1,4-beta-mannosidase
LDIHYEEEDVGMKHKWMSKGLAVAVALGLLAPGALWKGAGEASAATSINPASTAAVQDVLNYFDTVYANNQIISGQYVRGQTYGYTETDHLAYATGKYPAMIGFDFLYNVTNAADLATWRNYIVEQAADYWKKGGLVTISWHQTNPLDAAPDEGAFASVASSMSQADFDLMTTPGTALYNKWLAHIDAMAVYLKALRDQGVVVLWRPYHEMNYGFWWGYKTGASYKKLWENMYDRYTNVHGLNNLIWVWSPSNHGTIGITHYPGSSYVDLGGVDLYTHDRADAEFAYSNSELASVMGTKRYGLAEVGLFPWETAAQSSYDYTWFLSWAIGWMDNDFYGHPAENGPGNNNYQLTQFYANPVTITRDEVPSFGRSIVTETNVFKDAMNGYSLGGAPTAWTTATTGGTVTVEKITPTDALAKNRILKINKTSTTGAASAEKTLTLQTGIVQIRASLRTDDIQWKDFTVYDSTGKAALHMAMHNGYLKAYDGATTLVNIAPITHGSWYDVRVVLNAATKKYDVYVGGAKLANQLGFKNAAAADVGRLKVGVAADAAGVYYMDNVFVTK